MPNLDSPGTTIVAFGDSITYGVGASQAAAYPSALSRRLGVEVINAGVPGETSAEGLARLPEVLELDPWLVIIEFGGNDLLQRRPLEVRPKMPCGRSWKYVWMSRSCRCW